MNPERQPVVAAVALLALLCAGSLWVLHVMPRPFGTRSAGDTDPPGAGRRPQRDPWPGVAVRSETRRAAPSPDATAASTVEDGTIPNQHLVRARSAAAWQQLAARLSAAGGRLRLGVQELGFGLVELPAGIGLAPLLDGLDIEWAGPNHIVRIPERDAAPIQLTGVDQRSFRDAYLAWLGVQGDNSTWGAGMKVAVIDNGLGAGGPFRPGQVQSVDLVGGPIEPGADSADHGAAIAALIAGPPGTGIAPGAQILDIRALDAQGYGDSYTLAEAILTASRLGANIINLSLGSYGDSPAVRAALEQAWARGVIVVASAGNDGAAMLTYPARYEGVVSVAAVDAAGAPLAFSNSERGMDFAGPGLGIQVSMGDGTAITISGTSPSAAFLSGILAAVRSWEPALGSAGVLALLDSLANDLDAPGADESTGRGTIDLQRVAQRSQRGIYDMALSGFHLDAARATDAGVPLTIGVQNRGTEFVPSAHMRATVGVNTYNFTIPSIRPGESRGQTVTVSLAALKGSAPIAIEASVAATGATDARPSNDRLRSTIALRQGD